MFKKIKEKLELKQKLKTKIFATFFVMFFFSFSYAVPLTQASDITFNPSVAIPGAPRGQIQPTGIAQYIKAIYRYAIGIGAIVATVILMFGGIRWITAGGNSSAIDSAKSWIMASITGLLLLMFTYTILYLINPDLVNFKEINLQPVPEGEMVATEEPERNEIEEEDDQACLGASWGSSCESSYTGPHQCYNGECVGGIAEIGEPCGTQEGGTCMATSFYLCPSGYSWPGSGGRSCNGSKCCISD